MLMKLAKHWNSISTKRVPYEFINWVLTPTDWKDCTVKAEIPADEWENILGMVKNIK